ncbi:MAG: 3-deoxy-manno-octulosonate cytidylyltransferase [Nevskiales bacterium]
MTAVPEFFVVIPARFASTRFPGKPLAQIAGRPMIRHVFERACASGAAEVILATDDKRIAEVARGFGAAVVMTRTEHVSGTERVAEVAVHRGWARDALVVNVQGDSPLVAPENIGAVAELLAQHPAASIATLCTPITSVHEYTSRNIVKVVMDQSGRALYFSRASIPSTAHGAAGLPAAWRHLGLYAYRAADLSRLSRAPPCALEETERLEQLRALWLGMEIRIGIAPRIPGPDVDAPDDVAAVERIIAAAGTTAA